VLDNRTIPKKGLEKEEIYLEEIVEGKNGIKKGKNYWNNPVCDMLSI
jgi:hypothetical protein